METKRPTIKGMFVNSHIGALRKLKGDAAVVELSKRFGGPVEFSNLQDVPVSDEVAIIEHALDLSSDAPVPPEARAFEAGRLHFKNFANTPFGKILFSQFRNQFKTCMMMSGKIAGHVFNGVKFDAEDLGPASVKVTMVNNDYPPDHFKGLFQEWLEFSGHTGKVEAKVLPGNLYEYTMSWN